MRKQLQRGALLGAVLAAGGVMAQPAIQNFTLSNQTGATIAEVYISPTLTEDWGSDVLGRDVLQHGEASPIVFSPLNDVCSYDIMVSDLVGQSLGWGGINLCRVSVVTLTLDPATNEPTALTR